IGPLLVERALTAAPLPRPPQPTRATWISSLPLRWTSGSLNPERADAAATPPAACKNCRREGCGLFSVLMVDLGQTNTGCRLKRLGISSETEKSMFPRSLLYRLANRPSPIISRRNHHDHYAP